MRGFSKNFSTKQDVLNCLELYPEETKVEVRGMIDGRFVWEKTGDLESREMGVEDETHKVLEARNESGENDVKFEQFEWVEDENARLFRLGFTVEEAERLIA